MSDTFEQAWSIVKMPIHETGIHGIRFVTQGEDEPRWNDMDNVFGYVPTLGQLNSAIEPMTPHKFLTRTIGDKVGRGLRGGRRKRKEGPFRNMNFANIYDMMRHEEKNRESNEQLFGDKDQEGKFIPYRTPKLTPRDAGDIHYRDLMDRAQAGEDILFGMPYIFPDMDDEDLKYTGHEGRHKMAELVARGHGDKPLPVKVIRGK